MDRWAELPPGVNHRDVPPERKQWSGQRGPLPEQRRVLHPEAPVARAVRYVAGARNDVCAPLCFQRAPFAGSETCVRECGLCSTPFVTQIQRVKAPVWWCLPCRFRVTLLLRIPGLTSRDAR